MKKTIVPLFVALIMAGSLVITANIVSDTALNIKNKGYVNVKGYARETIKSDLGIFEAVIISENADLKTCYSGLAEDSRKLSAYITRKFGVNKNELKTRPASIQEVYKINENGYNTDEFVKYVIKQEIRIESGDVFKISRISSEIIDVLDEGIRINIKEPRYIYTGIEGLKVEMIGRATDNARERAMKIAKEGKFRLGRIADVRVGVFQITPVNSTDVSDYGVNDTGSIIKEIKSVVEIKYFVK
ncbi:MAG: SIMPL domain-containing protein [Candidatus Omnitrophota bacterium]